MPRPRSAMRKIREILRLALDEGLSRRQVAAATGMPDSTVGDHLARARLAGLSWPLPEGVDDAWLEARLFAPPSPPLPSELRRRCSRFAWRNRSRSLQKKRRRASSTTNGRPHSRQMAEREHCRQASRSPEDRGNSSE